MDFNEQAEARYKELEKELTEIDKEMKEKKAKIRSGLAGLEKYLVAVGLRKKKVKLKKK